MVSSSALAKPSVCLRLQFRDIIFSALRQSRVDPRGISHLQLSRPLHTSNRRDQEQDSHSSSQSHAQLTGNLAPNIRKVGGHGRQNHSSNGRIVGKPGRRQRVVSEQLKTSFLDKPASVIILRDIKETQSPSSVHTEHDAHNRRAPKVRASTQLSRRITAEEIEGYIASEQFAPKDEEIVQSIDELRPESSVVDTREFNDLAQRLASGFTFPQLTHYLAKSERSGAPSPPSAGDPASEGELETSERLQWQPGRTPIQQRHYHIRRRGRVNSKAYVIDQLLRDIWKITVSSEEQEIGELEIILQPWQVSLLLDVTHGGQPSYQSLLKSEFLIKASHVQAHRPDNVLRITARRQDAEEILQQIKLALLSVLQFDFDLAAFTPLLTVPGMQSGHRSSYRQSDLDHISSLTRSHISMIGDHSVRIYSFSEPEQNTARHLLLELLGIPPHRSFDTAFENTFIPSLELSPITTDITYAPMFLSGSAPRHFLGHDLRRAVRTDLHPRKDVGVSNEVPARRRSFTPKMENVNDQAAAIAMQLDGLVCPNNMASFQTAQGGRMVLSKWNADFCQVMQDFAPHHGRLEIADGQLNDTRTVVTHPQAPGFETLATYLEPTTEERRPHRTIVHMRPSPNASIAQDALPTVMVSFQDLGPHGHLELVEVRAIFDEQALRVPLPSQVVDVQFKRQLYLDLDIDDCTRNKHLQRLSEMIRNSLSHDTQLLTADAEISLPLPDRLVDRSKKSDDLGTGHNIVDVPYLLERFEVVETQHFQPALRAQPNEVIQNIPENMLLEYKEVYGGVIGSTHSSLGLVASKPSSLIDTGIARDDLTITSSEKSGAPPTSLSNKHELPSSVSSVEVVRTALLVAVLLSRARNGSLPPLSESDADHIISQ